MFILLHYFRIPLPRCSTSRLLFFFVLSCFLGTADSYIHHNLNKSNEHNKLNDLPYDPGNIRRGWRTYRGTNYNSGNINNVIFTSNGNSVAYTKYISAFPITSGILYSNKKDLVYVSTVEGQIIALYAGCTGSVAWEVNLGLPISVTPVLDDTEEILYIAVSGSTNINSLETSQIWAINCTDGTFLWTNPFIPPIPAYNSNVIQQSTSLSIISDLRYIHPNMLIITATSGTLNIVYVINTNLTTTVITSNTLHSTTTTTTSSLTDTVTVDTPRIVDPPIIAPNVIWNCLTLSPIHQPIALWSPWRLITTPSSSSNYDNPDSNDWLGYGSMYMVSDDGTVYGIDLDSNDPTSCPFTGAPVSGGTLSSVTCEACATWVLQRGNRLLGRITSGPVIHPITSKEVTPASVVSPYTRYSNNNNNINITASIVSARLFIATSVSTGYSGGIYAFNLTAGGIPPLPVRTLMSAASASVPYSSSTIGNLTDNVYFNKDSSSTSTTTTNNVRLSSSFHRSNVPDKYSASTISSSASSFFTDYNPSYVRDSKQLIYSVTGVSYSIAPTPFIIFPNNPPPSTSTSYSNSSSFFSSTSSLSTGSPILVPWSEWLVIGTSVGEVICLDVTINGTDPSRVVSVPTSTSIVSTASLVWWIRIPSINNPAPITAGPIYDGITAMVGVGDGSIVNIDIRTGLTVWGASTSAGAMVPVSRGGLIVDTAGKVYASNANGFVVALDSNCPVAPHEVIYISIAVTGTILCSIIMIYYCIQAEKARRRIGIQGPTREFIDSILRIASSVPEWSRRISSSVNQSSDGNHSRYPFTNHPSFRTSNPYLPLGGRVRRRSRTSTGASVDLTNIGNTNDTIPPNTEIDMPNGTSTSSAVPRPSTTLELPLASLALREKSRIMNNNSILPTDKITDTGTGRDDTTKNNELTNNNRRSSLLVSVSLPVLTTIPVVKRDQEGEGNGNGGDLLSTVSTPKSVSSSSSQSRSRTTSISQHLPFPHLFSTRSRTGSDGITNASSTASVGQTSTAAVLGKAAAKLLNQSNVTLEEIQQFPRISHHGTRGYQELSLNSNDTLSQNSTSSTARSYSNIIGPTGSTSMTNNPNSQFVAHPITRIRLPLRADPSFSELDHITVDDLLTPRDNLGDPSGMMMLHSLTKGNTTTTSTNSSSNNNTASTSYGSVTKGGFTTITHRTNNNNNGSILTATATTYAGGGNNSTTGTMTSIAATNTTNTVSSTTNHGFGTSVSNLLFHRSELPTSIREEESNRLLSDTRNSSTPSSPTDTMNEKSNTNVNKDKAVSPKYQPPLPTLATALHQIKDWSGTSSPTSTAILPFRKR